MKKNEIEARVIGLASDILGVKVDLSSSMGNPPAWDSLRHMELIFAFEDAFGVRLDETELVKLRSIEALVKKAGGGQ